MTPSRIGRPARKIVVPGVSRAQGRRSETVQILVVLVALPAVALLAVVFLMLLEDSYRVRLVFAAVTAVLVACLAVGTTLAILALRRQERLAAQQNEFISRAGHELRTPLTAITMCAETLLLGRERSPRERRELLETLASETTRLRERIDRLLDWGRIEAGRRRYHRKEVDLRKVVRDAVRVASPTVQARDQVLDVDAGVEPVQVEGDREALTDALINLLANASKYSPNGSRVEVGLARTKEAARLWVRDRGIGIPKRELGRIFQKFYRVPGATGGRDEGVGLGLAIVRDVVAAHGGRIEIESAPGAGTTLTLVLPLEGPGGSA